MPLTASDLYAQANQCKNHGDFECYYCGAKCSSTFIHENNPVLQHTRAKEPAKRPGNQFMCAGCWQWRRQRITVPFLSGLGDKPFLDRQTPAKHSWLVTEKGAWGLRHPEDYSALYDFLTHPTCSFSLLIVSSGQQNYLQQAAANDMSVVNGDTPIAFTIDGIPYQYTIYELEHALQHGAEGKEPGIRALFDLWQPPKPVENPPKRGRGRPLKEDEEDGRRVTKMVRKSGVYG